MSPEFEIQFIRQGKQVSVSTEKYRHIKKYSAATGIS